MQAKFYDISHYQSEALFNRAIQNADGFIFKISQGKTVKDKTSPSRIRRIMATGKPWMFYHFFDNGAAEEQAKNILESLRGLAIRGIIWIDYELLRSTKKERYKDICTYTAIKGILESAGFKVGIYTSYSIYKEIKDWIADSMLWIARYNLDLYHKNPFWALSISRNCVMWQYNDVDIIARKEYSIDVNIYYGGIQAVDNLLRKRG